MPKDIGAIIAYMGFSPFTHTGRWDRNRGILAAHPAYFNKYGEVITVEKRKEFAKIARDNFRIARLKNIH